jgi:hypothetical protein
MKKLLVLIPLLLFAVNVQAKEVGGITVPEQVTVGTQTLNLNGYGYRTKWFFKIYLGSLYSAHPISSLADAEGDSGAKLIRMTFIYHRVGAEKIVDAYTDDFDNNNPGLSKTPAAKRFLSFFTTDFVKGDIVDLALEGSGKVTVIKNGKILGSVTSLPLEKGILAVYLGKEPADEDMKEGMLGKSS